MALPDAVNLVDGADQEGRRHHDEENPVHRVPLSTAISTQG